MIIKVCGMNNAANMKAIDQLQPELLGMIFYEKSARYVDDFTPPDTKAPKVGVFVDAAIDQIIEIALKHELVYIQLHGNEDASVAKGLYDNGYKVIKAFSVSDKIELESIQPFTPYCSYFLFDTKGKNPGGNGVQFNWSILDDYTLEVPFLLSGGIGSEDVEAIQQLNHPLFAGVDINSRFEEKPGIKNIELVKRFINANRTEQT